MTQWSSELESPAFWGSIQNKTLLGSGIYNLYRDFSEIGRWCRLMRQNSENLTFLVLSGAISADFTIVNFLAKSKSLNIDDAVVIGT